MSRPAGQSAEIENLRPMALSSLLLILAALVASVNSHYLDPSRSSFFIQPKSSGAVQVTLVRSQRTDLVNVRCTLKRSDPSNHTYTHTHSILMPPPPPDITAADQPVCEFRWDSREVTATAAPAATAPPAPTAPSSKAALLAPIFGHCFHTTVGYWQYVRCSR
jgi:hypothetical protein